MIVQYVEKIVSSGQTVKVRARTYSEWEDQENSRLALVASIPDLAKDGSVQEAELVLQRASFSVRNARLCAWVEDFDTVKGALTLRDIAEIERTALELEREEIPLGNSEAGGGGQ